MKNSVEVEAAISIEDTLRLAQEAIEHLSHNARKAGVEMGLAFVVADEAITAIKEALMSQSDGAQPAPVAKAWQELTLACQRVASPDQSIELRDALDRFADAISEYDARPLTLDYIQGHKDGCEWSARLATANDPRTSDWLYDDPDELAKALRKGPEFPPVPAAQPGHEQKPVAIVAEVHMSRYTIEWTNGPLPEGTKLYTTPYVATPLPQRPSRSDLKPLTLGQKQRLWSSLGHKPTLKDRVNAYGSAIEAAHGITDKGQP